MDPKTDSRDFNVGYYTCGSRPKPGQKLYDNWKNDKNKIPYKDFQVELQKWYNQDGGVSMQQE